MNRERAKFILQSFRPSGEDIEDHDFMAALKMATVDLELGKWLVDERIFDAEFAESFARVELPKRLREDVLLAMVRGVEVPNDFPEKDEFGFAAAMGSIEVPQDLRSKVIEAMDQSIATRKTAAYFPRWGIALGLAATIMIGALTIFSMRQSQSDTVLPEQVLSTEEIEMYPTIADDRVTIKAVEAGFVRTFESPLFSLDNTASETKQLIAALRERGLPCGDGMIPQSLKSIKGLGCRELMIDGKRGSLLSFDDDGGSLHLLIFRKADVRCHLPKESRPAITQEGDWAHACWENDKFAFALMGLRDHQEMAKFF